MRRLSILFLLIGLVVAGLFCLNKALAQSVNSWNLGSSNTIGNTCCVNDFPGAPGCSGANGVTCLLDIEGLAGDVAPAPAFGKLNPIGEWAAQATPGYIGPCINTKNVVGSIPCEAGLCIQFSTTNGDAAAPCPTLYDAGAYLAAAGLAFPPQTIDVGYVQTTTQFPTTPGSRWALEERVAMPNYQGSNWPIAWTFYGVASSLGSCQIPDIAAASLGGTCGGSSTAGTQEYDISEWQSSLGPNIFDFGFWGLSCLPPNHINYTVTGPGNFHIDTFVFDWKSGSSAGPRATWYFDGVEIYSLPPEDGGVCSTLPQVEGPLFAAFGLMFGPNTSVGGGGGYPYDAGPPPPIIQQPTTMQLDYGRIVQF